MTLFTFGCVSAGITLGLLILWVILSSTDPNKNKEALRGQAAWYGDECAGKPMANGQPFDPNALTCASWDYPLGTVLTIQECFSLRTVTVTVTDRGPSKLLRDKGRIIDLSSAAFAKLAPLNTGTITVQIREVDQLFS